MDSDFTPEGKPASVVDNITSYFTAQNVIIAIIVIIIILAIMRTRQPPPAASGGCAGGVCTRPASAGVPLTATSAPVAAATAGDGEGDKILASLNESGVVV